MNRSLGPAPRGRTPRLHRVAILALTLSVLLPGLQAVAQGTSEYAVKAAFLFHFAQLTSWPADALPAGAPLTFCTIGKDPFAGELEKVIANKSVQNHRLNIVHLKNASGSRSCNILFVSAQQESESASALTALHGAPVLVTGETDSLLRQGGMITFERKDDRLRFNVNTGTAAKCAISFSSTLLGLAASVVQDRQ